MAPTTIEDRAVEVLRFALDGFESSPADAQHAIMTVLGKGSPAVADAGLALLRNGPRTRGYRFLLEVLIETGALLDAVSDRGRLSVNQAAGLIKFISGMDPLLDVKLLRSLLDRLEHSHGDDETFRVREVLAVYDSAGLGGRLSPLLVQLLRKRDPHVRSKVALLVGRGSSHVGWAIVDPDHRVRANAIESLWGSRSNTARTALWRALRDPHQRVVGNAVVGLLLIGESGAREEARRMARHAAGEFRASAAWAMGQSKDASFEEQLREMLSDPQEAVQRNARRALAALGIKETEPEASPAPQPETKPPERPAPSVAEEPAPPPREEDAGTYTFLRGLRLN